MLEINKIHCGDNCDLMMQLPRECIDLVVTSPPYDDLRTYGGHSWDFFGVAWNLRRVLKPGGVIVWVVADATKDGSETGTSMEQALHFKRLGLNLHDTMTYEKKGQHMERFGHKKYPGAWEFCFVFSLGAPKTFNPIKDVKTANRGKNSSTVRNVDGTLKKSHSYGRDTKEFAIRNNCWSYAVGKGHTDKDFPNDHPASFPIDFASDHIATWSNPCDLILDPFMGSGTTAKAAKALNRNFIGIEINPEYCAIAERRIAQNVLDLSA